MSLPLHLPLSFEKKKLLFIEKAFEGQYKLQEKRQKCSSFAPAFVLLVYKTMPFKVCHQRPFQGNSTSPVCKVCVCV